MQIIQYNIRSFSDEDWNDTFWRLTNTLTQQKERQTFIACAVSASGSSIFVSTALHLLPADLFEFCPTKVKTPALCGYIMLRILPRANLMHWLYSNSTFTIDAALMPNFQQLSPQDAFYTPFHCCDNTLPNHFWNTLRCGTNFCRARCPRRWDLWT